MLSINQFVEKSTFKIATYWIFLRINKILSSRYSRKLICTSPDKFQLQNRWLLFRHWIAIILSMKWILDGLPLWIYIHCIAFGESILFTRCLCYYFQFCKISWKYSMWQYTPVLPTQVYTEKRGNVVNNW